MVRFAAEKEMPTSVMRFPESAYFLPSGDLSVATFSMPDIISNPACAIGEKLCGDRRCWNYQRAFEVA